MHNSNSDKNCQPNKACLFDDNYRFSPGFLFHWIENRNSHGCAWRLGAVMYVHGGVE